MRDYIIESLPFRPIVSIEPIPCDQLEGIVDKAMAALHVGANVAVGDMLKGRLSADPDAPPRTIALLIMTRVVKRVQLGDGRKLASTADIARWLHGIPDDVALELFRECVIRAN